MSSKINKISKKKRYKELENLFILFDSYLRDKQLSQDFNDYCKSKLNGNGNNSDSQHT